MKELEGVCDEVFNQMTESAKQAWIKLYGLEALKELVPIFHCAYLAEPIDRNGRKRSLILFINNCLRNEMKYSERPKGSLDFKEICK